MKEYQRQCQICKFPIKYRKYKTFWKARKYNSSCRPCFYKSLIGHPTSEITKKKIGEANKISLLGNIPPNKGVPMKPKQRKLLSKLHTGMKYAEVTKRKHRINMLKRLQKLGIGSAVDRGAKEFFDSFNKVHNFKFQPKRFWNLGYDADGYDVSYHMWAEFDTPYHRYVDGSLKPKDVVRQTNIIKYFESVGNPLKEFIRINADKLGNVLSINTVYKGGF